MLRNKLSSVFLVLFCLLLLPKNAEAQVTVRRHLPEEELLPELMEVPVQYIPNYRDLMRDLVITLSRYAKNRDANFQIMVREGLYLLTRGQWEQHLDELHIAQAKGIGSDDEAFIEKMFRQPDEDPPPVGMPIRRYVQSIDAEIIDGMFCKNEPPDAETQKTIDDAGITVLGIEHCATDESIAEALRLAAAKKIPLHVDKDALDKFDSIPASPPYLENANNINSLKDARNMLVMTNSKNYGNRQEWVLALSKSNHDVLVIDAFYKGKEALTKDDVKTLKFKNIGSRRKLIARMSLSEAADNRFYWQNGWRLRNPSWLRMLSKTNAGGIIVEYWNPEWKEILGRYFRGIMDLGFDGVMFDDLDVHHYFERMTPID